MQKTRIHPHTHERPSKNAARELREIIVGARAPVAKRPGPHDVKSGPQLRLGALQAGALQVHLRGPQLGFSGFGGLYLYCTIQRYHNNHRIYIRAGSMERFRSHFAARFSPAT